MKTICEIRGYHANVSFDRFGSIPFVGRTVPGDCYCHDCKQPIAANWNRGRPVPVKGHKIPAYVASDNPN